MSLELRPVASWGDKPINLNVSTLPSSLAGYGLIRTHLEDDKRMDSCRKDCILKQNMVLLLVTSSGDVTSGDTFQILASSGGQSDSQWIRLPPEVVGSPSLELLSRG